MAHWRPRVQTGLNTAATNTLAQPAAGAPEQSYAGKVVTYIPAEIIAAYQAAVGIIPPNSTKALGWAGIGLLILAPLWTAFATTHGNARIPWYQAFAALVAFAIWLL